MPRTVPTVLACAALALIVVAGCTITAAPAGPAATTIATSDGRSTDQDAAGQSRPFEPATIAALNRPWALAFLPDRRVLVTEKAGRLLLLTTDGSVQPVDGVPPVSTGIQNGLLDIAASPGYTTDRLLYFTYSAPGLDGGLRLARARLEENGTTARLTAIDIIWRQESDNGSYWGGVITFSPDGRHLFLAVRDSARNSTDPSGAQDGDRSLGKVLRLNPDGSTPADNPDAASGGVRGQVWTSGHRTSYGLAHAPDGTLWQSEMGPQGGDELNVLRPGENYGWPLVSEGADYDGAPLARHADRPDLHAPALSWTPVIAPGGMTFYHGDAFPAWDGSLLLAGLVSESLVRVIIDAAGRAREAERWAMSSRIRDVAVAGDGSVWYVEDASPGRLVRLVPLQ
ncbi:PQQ-dependent sugar dehydrogenase [Nonomuraea sp. NPDC052129]|uniref:PQQ-dependent sugar dehydrogenase n=1 Tax=Nonomuraea sp. NPDC052129 TaxID=3154651 RepID=UPI00343885FE